MPTEEREIIRLKAELFDLSRERKRILVSLAGLNEVIDNKIAELEELEKDEKKEIVN
jgi:hypothetical protein